MYIITFDLVELFNYMVRRSMCSKIWLDSIFGVEGLSLKQRKQKVPLSIPEFHMVEPNTTSLFMVSTKSKTHKRKLSEISLSVPNVEPCALAPLHACPVQSDLSYS